MNQSQELNADRIKKFFHLEYSSPYSFIRFSNDSLKGRFDEVYSISVDSISIYRGSYSAIGEQRFMVLWNPGLGRFNFFQSKNEILDHRVYELPTYTDSVYIRKLDDSTQALCAVSFGGTTNKEITEFSMLCMDNMGFWSSVISVETEEEPKIELDKDTVFLFFKGIKTFLVRSEMKELEERDYRIYPTIGRTIPFKTCKSEGLVE
jgi:hypothetical protein